MSDKKFVQSIQKRVEDYAIRFRSQNDFARHVGVSQSAMSCYMKGERAASVPMAIAENCPEVSLEWLFRGDGAMLLADQQTDQRQEPELPRPGNDPELVRILLDRIETQAVELSRLREENDRFKRALGVV